MKTHYSKVRVGLVSLFFALTFVLFFARLLYVQVIKGNDLRTRARRQYLQVIDLPAQRGEIFDTNGNKVAINSYCKSMFAYPLTDRDVEASYDLMSQVFKASQKNLRKEYKLKPRTYCWIKRGLSDDEVTRFEELDRQCGLFLREEPTREYPYGDIGRAILGFVDIDNCGRAGIEMVMEDDLAGIPGRSMIQKNGIGEEYRIREVPLKKAESGRSVVLTIDWDKQQIVEEELARAVEKYHAKGGMAIFVQPQTGAILAAADCTAGGDADDKPMKLCAVANTFEPGSVFKVITAAAALEDGSIQPSDTFFAENGVWHLGQHILRDDHKYGWLTFRESFEFSSNINMGKIANQIGGDKVFAMAQRFGFGRKVRCGLNSESRGLLVKPDHWSLFVTSTFAIGHGVSVTPVQMAQAIAVVASGGNLCQPHIVAGCINDEGHIVERHTSRPVKILDDDIVATLDSFMRGVVERGTGKDIGKTPFPIAAKTGTAEKPNLETGGYFKNKFMASFAGYFPADSPLVAGIIILDEPEPIHYGGLTAGPAFAKIAIKFAAIDKYDVGIYASMPEDEAPDYPEAATQHPEYIQVPDVIGDSRGKAAYRIEKLGLSAEFSGTGDEVIATRPTASSPVAPGESIHCYLEPEDDQITVVPDLKGLTMREAIALLDTYGLAFTCVGKGLVISQSPQAGTKLNQKDKVHFECERHKGV